MERRRLGTLGLQVSAIGLGCMGMSEYYGTPDETEGIRTIRRAIELEVRFLGMADMYGPFKNELLVGRAIRGVREEVVLATKFGNVRAEDGTSLGIRGDPEYVKQACDASLKRLGTDVLDLYYQHRLDTTVPIADTVGAKDTPLAEIVPTLRPHVCVAHVRQGVHVPAPSIPDEQLLLILGTVAMLPTGDTATAPGHASGSGVPSSPPRKMTPVGTATIWQRGVVPASSTSRAQTQCSGQRQAADEHRRPHFGPNSRAGGRKKTAAPIGAAVPCCLFHGLYPSVHDHRSRTFA